jgi:N-acetylneuraminic acid mutarotase
MGVLLGGWMTVSAQGPNVRMLAPLPQAIAGQCVGRVGHALVVAGGSTWSAPPWDGGVKGWHSAVYVLHSPDGAWKRAEDLPEAMAYGASAQWGDALLCVGGQNATRTFDTVLRFRMRDGKIVRDELARLPESLTNAGAAVVDGTLYVVGGQRDVTAMSASKEIWSLKLESGAAWQRSDAPPWPHARILPAVAGCGGNLYVLSGADLRPHANGAPWRTYLRDAWLRNASGVWERLPELPAPVVAAPTVCDAKGRVLIFGGDDGKLASQIPTLRDNHPGFSRRVLAYDALRHEWIPAGELPLSLVTSGVTLWHGNYVIAGGESHPGHRSDEVVALTFQGPRGR